MASKLHNQIIKARAGVKRTLRSTKGKNVLLYLLFVCVAFVFWVFLSLDAEIQRDFEVPVELENVPDSVVIIGDVPSQFNVVVQAKGSQLLTFMWGKMPVMKIKFSQTSGSKGKFSMTRSKLDARLRDYFGQGVQILSLRPDSLKFAYTSSAGRRLPIKLTTDIKPNLQCIISGPIRCSADSVTVYSSGDFPRDLTEITSEPIVLSDIKDTTVVTVDLKGAPGIRIIPDKVTVTVPVEPLISRRRKVGVEIRNLPEGMGMITFPSAVEVSYLVPMSRYHEDIPLKVYADYQSLTPGAQKLKVNVTLVPDMYRNVSVNPDSVEFIIEKPRE
ncbi:MAG: hypothetical protein NC043_06540 [Muribaculaceae bacterium]|nr:hypothetical protein [Muribaculaceae bacterium]